MNTIKYTFILLLSSIGLLAQPEAKGEDSFERIEAARIGFITEKLDLSTEEAQRFWPVYNEYRKELEQILHDGSHKRHHRISREAINKMSDSEVEQMLKKELMKQQLLVSHREKYFYAFTKVLPVKKVAILYDAEREFQKKLMRQISDHHRQKR